MFRNVFGSIGISLATALVRSDAQIHQTYLSQWATPFHQPYNELIATYEQCAARDGPRRRGRHDVAVGRIYQMFRAQVSVLAYSDVFLTFAVVAFVVVPFCFLLSAQKAPA